MCLHLCSWGRGVESSSRSQVAQPLALHSHSMIKKTMLTVVLAHSDLVMPEPCTNLCSHQHSMAPPLHHLGRDGETLCGFGSRTLRTYLPFLLERALWSVHKALFRWTFKLVLALGRKELHGPSSNQQATPQLMVMEQRKNSPWEPGCLKERYLLCSQASFCLSCSAVA